MESANLQVVNFSLVVFGSSLVMARYVVQSHKVVMCTVITYSQVCQWSATISASLKVLIKGKLTTYWVNDNTVCAKLIICPFDLMEFLWSF